MNSIAIVVNVQHDWLDYLAAYSGAVGGAAAVVALILAGLSKREAARSADAAEATKRLADEQVEIMRKESAAAKSERDRRAAPEIRLGAHAPGARDNEAPAIVILTVGFSNDNGTRAVDRLTVNLSVPSVMQLRTAADRYGNPGGNGNIADAPSEVLGDHVGALYWNEVLGPIDQHVNVVRYLSLGSPPVRTHRIEAEIVNRDLPGGRSSHAWDMSIPSSGDRVELVPVPIASAR